MLPIEIQKLIFLIFFYVFQMLKNVRNKQLGPVYMEVGDPR